MTVTRMTTMLFAAAFLIITIAVSGCEKKPKYGIRDYFPLSIGNTWTYRFILTQQYPYSRNTYTYVDSIIDRYDWGRTRFYKLKRSFGSGRYESWFAYVNDELRRYFDDPPSEDYEVVLKEPLEQGHQWVNRISPYAGVYTMEIVDTDASVFIPTGQFHECLEIELTYFGHVTTFWYALDVGLIKSRSESGGGNQVEELVLLDYSVQ